MVYKQLEILENFRKIHDLEVINNQSDLKRLSRDFYNYSPILKSKLDGCIADLVVRPKYIQAVLAVAKKCWDMSLPLTIRLSLIHI